MRRSLFITIFMSLGFLNSLNSFANIHNQRHSCSTIINIKPVISKIRHQGEVGWCYAFSAADLLSYKLNKRVSAVYFAVKSNEKDFLNVIKGKFASSYTKQEAGFAYNILKDLLENVDQGICLEKDAPSSDYAFFQVEMIINLVEMLYDKYTFIRLPYLQLERDNESLDKARRVYQISMNAFFKSKEFKDYVDEVYLNYFSFNSILKIAFPNIDINDFIEVLRSSSRNTFYANLVKKTCEGRKGILRKVLKPMILRRYIHSKNAKIKRINLELEKNNIIEITYKDSILESPMQPLTGLHSSLIVGRRFDKASSQCEYLIQNSYGTICTGYSKEHKCEKGRVWIKEHFLKKALLDVTWIERR